MAQDSIAAVALKLARDSLRQKRADGGTTYIEQLLGTVGGSAKDNTATDGSKVEDPITESKVKDLIAESERQRQQDQANQWGGGGSGGGDGTAGGLGDSAPGASDANGGPGSAGGSPAGDGGGTAGGAMAYGGLAKAGGGQVETVKAHVGPIHSTVAGRTDHLPMHVKSGSYVIPADIISAMGEGNTVAGFRNAKMMFGGSPYKSMNVTAGSPYGGDLPKASGGATTKDSLVPIIAAGGEYVIGPDQVMVLGKGDLDFGHKILDSFVKKMRAKTISTLKKLPGPKKD